MTLSRSLSGKKIYPTNPIGIFALFVFFIEAIGTTCLIILDGDVNFHLRLIMVIFIASFPVIIAGLFFLIMWFKPTHMFSPGDVGNSDTWLEGIKVQLNEIKKEQALNYVSEHPPKNLDDVMALVNDLLLTKEYKSIVRIGRGYLKTKEYEKGLKLFKYVLEKVPKSEDFYYTFQANCAYSLIGMKQYKKAIQYLVKIEARLRDKIAVWHLAAFTYCYRMLGDIDKFEMYYNATVSNHAFHKEKSTFEKIYPEVSWHLDTVKPGGINENTAAILQ
jgi:tetratricopeptide (TPR) repeat protein